jgi:hypothetical protein
VGEVFHAIGVFFEQLAAVKFTALGLAVALGATYALAHEGVNAWWLLPIGVVIVLVASVWREATMD